MRYYRNHWLYANNPISGAYLRRAYEKGIENLRRLDFQPDFTKTNFTALLCGVGNERTAAEFITFVTKRNATATIWIIDIAEENLKAVQELVIKKYPNNNIHIKKINALELLTIIPKNSIDWIETDAFLEFFDNASLEKLLMVWRELLKPDGFITTRDYVNGGAWSSMLINPLRYVVMEMWLGVNTYKHSQEDFDAVFEKVGLRVIEEPTFLPTYKHFSLMKK
jgi:SAM-dependent methyltransferase